MYFHVYVKFSKEDLYLPVQRVDSKYFHGDEPSRFPYEEAIYLVSRTCLDGDSTPIIEHKLVLVD